MDKKNKEQEQELGSNGAIVKAAQVAIEEVTDKELNAINKLTLEPLKKEDVFTCKIAMCDNEVDRTHEYFNQKALKDLSKLYVGKTIIKDHNYLADNQFGRIYATELSYDESKVTKHGEVYTELISKFYMLNNEKNKDLIADIKAGIKKEVSVGCSVGKVVCSICGADQTKSYCRHYNGRTYDGQVCEMSLEDVKDAYEVSFVAVPAQKQAGTRKSYGYLSSQYDASLDDSQEIESPKIENQDKEKELNARLRAVDSFLFVKNHSQEN